MKEGKEMGAHKHNPTAIAAKKGELPPKPKKMPQEQLERILYAKCAEVIYEKFVGDINVGSKKKNNDENI